MRLTALAGASVVLAALIGLSGCSKPEAAPSFTSSTSAIAVPAASQPQIVNDANTRVLQVAWTSARADKCQFYYELPKLKAAYLASEVQGGAGEVEIARIDKAFDFTRASVAGRLATKSTYCQDEGNIRAIKSDLARYLTGDFSARAVSPQTAAAE
jgi:hypothetical protein